MQTRENGYVLISCEWCHRELCSIYLSSGFEAIRFLNMAPLVSSALFVEIGSPGPDMANSGRW